MWFTENAMMPMLLFGGLGLILAFTGLAQQKMKLVAVAVLLGIACGAIWFYEQQIVTDAELIEQKIYDLASDFQRNDMEAVLSHFSTQDLIDRGLAVAALEMVDIDNDYRITDMQVVTQAENTLAESHFRANVTANVRMYGNVGRQPTRWRVNWRKEADEWKIVDVQRLRLIGDEEMGILEANQ